MFMKQNIDEATQSYTFFWIIDVVFLFVIIIFFHKINTKYYLLHRVEGKLRIQKRYSSTTGSFLCFKHRLYVLLHVSAMFIVHQLSSASSNISEGVINGGNRVLKARRGSRVVVGYVHENKMCTHIEQKMSTTKYLGFYPSCLRSLGVECFKYTIS